MQTLQTERLWLTPLVADDAPAMFGLLRDPALYAHLDSDPPPSVDHLRSTYTRWEARRSPDGTQAWLNWRVATAQGEPLGYVQATVEATREAWIAYVLGRAHWGQGYAHEATAAMLAHLARAHGVRRLKATVEAGNTASIRLLQRLGFERAGSPLDRGLAPTELFFSRAA